MQQKLNEYFAGDYNGKPNLVTFRNKAQAVLRDFYSHQDFDPEADKLMIIEAAAKLIKDDVKAMKTSRTVYPGPGFFLGRSKGGGAFRPPEINSAPPRHNFNNTIGN